MSFLRTSSLRTPYLFSGRHQVGRLLHWQGRPLIVEFDFGTATRQVRVTVIDPTRQLSATSEPGRALPAHFRTVASALWGLDDNLTQCYATLCQDPLLAGLIASNRGLRLIRTPDLYEALVMGVIGQQISVTAAEAIRHRLLLAVGPHRTVQSREYHGYPVSAQILDAGERALRGVGISHPKVRYLQAIAECDASGALSREAFDGLDNERAIQRLMDIPGVGRWTAEIAMLRGLGRLDIFPAADLGLIVATQSLLRLRARPTEHRLRTLAERWRGWRSYAALYLWATLTRAR